MPAPAITTAQYFRLPETMLPQELVYGILRDAHGPSPGHQSAVGSLFLALAAHVRQRGLGQVWFSPIDVVLDPEAHLVVQPDLIVVSRERLRIVSDRVWGAPDLVVEVLSPRPRIGRLEERLDWFARYGVRECWLLHQQARELEVLQFASGAVAERHTSSAHEPIRSEVLPHFTHTLQALL